MWLQTGCMKQVSLTDFRDTGLVLTRDDPSPFSSCYQAFHIVCLKLLRPIRTILSSSLAFDFSSYSCLRSVMFLQRIEKRIKATNP